MGGDLIIEDAAEARGGVDRPRKELAMRIAALLPLFLAAALGGALGLEGQGAATATPIALEETTNKLEAISYSIRVPKGTTATDVGFFHNYFDIEHMVTIQVLASPGSVGSLQEAVARSTTFGATLIEKQELAKYAYLVVTSQQGTTRATVYRMPPGQHGLTATCFSSGDVAVLKEMCASLKIR
jgi:hypothetical protein